MVKGRGKKKDVNASKADPNVPKTQSKQTIENSNNSKTSRSQQLECAYCDVEDEEVQWFVQCDGCKRQIHFTCAGISDIREEDPWSCRACQPEQTSTREADANVNEIDGQRVDSSNNESTRKLPNNASNTAGIQAHSSAILDNISERSENLSAIAEDGQENSRETTDQVPPTEVHPVNQAHQTTNPAPRSKVSKSQTVSSNSSTRRQDLELRRLQDELNLQTELAEKTLAFQLEALKMYEDRQRKYLDGKYKALSVGEGSIASKGSSKSSKTQKSVYVTEWVEQQREQAKQSKQKSVDELTLRNLQKFDEKINDINIESSTYKSKPKSMDDNKIRSSNIHRDHVKTSIPTSYFVVAQENHQTLQSKAAIPLEFRSQQEILDDQVQKFKTWRNKNNGEAQIMERSCSVQNPQLQSSIPSVNKEVLMKPQPTHQIQQLSFAASKSSEFVPKSRTVNWQQQRFPVLHEENKAYMQPECQSTLLRGQSTSAQGHQNQLNLDDQSNSTYVFSKHSQRANTSVTPSNHMYQSNCSNKLANSNLGFTQPISSMNNYYEDPQISPFRTAKQSMVTSQPVNPNIVSTGYDHGNPIYTLNGEMYSSNAGYENQYYDQLYSFHTPVSIQQNNVHHSQWIPMSSNSALSSNPIVSSMATSNGTKMVRAPLIPSQIAARHAFPKELPIFTGNPKDWRRFIKRFYNSTSMCGYSDDENLERLDRCLKDKARTLVEGLLLMPDSVPEIIDTLKEKYGRPEIIIKSVLNELKDFPKIRPDKLNSLSDYGYAVRNACKQIEDMQMNHYLCNPELIQELIDKLPHQTLIDWARYSQNIPFVTLRTLSDWLYNLSKTINRITTPEIPTSSSEQKNVNTGKNDRKPDDSSKIGYVYLHDNKRSSKRVAEPSRCPICGKDCKLVENCPKFKNSHVNEKWNLIFQQKLCKKCLKFHKERCHISKVCGVNGCEFKHHSLLHNEERHSKENSSSGKGESRPTELNGKKPEKFVKSGSSNSHHQGKNELHRIVPVDLFADNKKVITYAYLDEGSSFTLMERQIADKLGIKGIPETICLLWTNNVHRQEESEVVGLEISASNSKGNNEPSKRYKLNNVNVVQELSLPEQSLPVDEFKQRYEHLRKIPIAGYEKVVPTMLIGLQHARLAVPLETIESNTNEDQPIATRSRLGWSVYGPVGKTSSGYVNTHRIEKCPCQDRDEEAHKMIKDHFTIENFGVVAKNVSLDSKENEKAFKMLESITVRKENRFETGLLWKNEVYKMPESYGMARKRLQCLENKGPKIINVINEAVEDYVQKGYVHKLSPEELAKDYKRVWYLPLFTVINPKKPDKLRTVFDAAAKVKGVSLNSMLHNGPDLVPSIVDILRLFRENKIAVTGDIKEMYHQVMVNDEDKHAQRFLWRNGKSDKEPEIYVMDVLTFGSRSSPCSAQYVKNLNASEFEKDYPRAAVSIKKNTYVDDLMDGEKSVKEAIQLIKDAKFVHHQGGFEIRNFKSNSDEVLEAVGEPVSNEKVQVDDGSNIERVLGMFWDTKSDSFTFLLKYTKVSAEVLAGKKLPTKRELLKMLMSIFDPLGLLSYYLVHVKILLQNVWRSNIGWDNVIPENLQYAWNRWIKILPKVEMLRIPRWHFSEMSETNQDLELHVFVDAGDSAYASVAYLRFQSNSGHICSLVGSKTRAAPLKYLSTTRKELMAGVLGTRLSNSILEGLSSKIRRRIIWSDSTTVLIWLHSENQKYSQFVGHRVGEILETSELSEWRYVPSKLNAADEATKWLKTPTFDHTDRWFVGPEFLCKSEAEWPQPPKSIVPNGTTEEMRLTCSHSKLIMPSIVKPENFSKWERAVRAVALAIRWGKKLLAKIRKINLQREPITQEELLRAENLLFRQAQWQGFTEEMLILTKNQGRLEKQIKIGKASQIHDCMPYLDESGVMRVEGRLDKATALTFDAKRPIIMPRNNILTRLLLLSYHRKFLHRNHETVVNELRQRFHIPRIRVAFRSARWKCKLCEVKRSRPRPPKMADLPAIRFEPGTRVFTYTGIDYFGPINVMVGRRSEKRWGVLLTCLTVRAIHIEIAHSLDTASCIKVLRNFINTRGAPIEIYSDNGTCFTSADKELKEELKKLNEYELSTAVTSCYTKWNFNPPASPHMGGCWERLIGVVKGCMNEAMPTRTPRDEDLRSLLLEIMNIVNARPLTFIPLDSEDDEALTPNHFIFGSSNGIKPPGKFTNDGPYLKSTWREIQRCANIFWERFINEYVPTLTRRSKCFENVKPLEVGDIVLVIDETNPRNKYPRGRIVETIMGSKEQVRRAKVQFASGRALWRPACNLAVLDVTTPNPDPSQEAKNTAAPTEEKSLDHLFDNRNGGEYVGASKLNPSPSPESNTTSTNRKSSGNNQQVSNEF